MYSHPSTCTCLSLTDIPSSTIPASPKDLRNIPGLSWLAEEPYKNRLKPSNLVYVGLRDVDLPERATIKRLGIKYYSMYDIDR